VCELSPGTHLRGAQEGGPGRQVITISRRGILERLARCIRARRPRKRVLACQGNVRPVALKTSDPAPEDSATHADAPQARWPRLRIGIFRGSASICLFCLGKPGTMQSRSSLIGVNVTSNPDLRDSCWTSTIGKFRRIHAAPRTGPMKSAALQFSEDRVGPIGHIARSPFFRTNLHLEMLCPALWFLSHHWLPAYNQLSLGT
jgi:hypothetical protein